MKAIKSKRELIYNSRSGKSAIIMVKIINWTRDIQSNSYKALVRDYKIESTKNINNTISENVVSINEKLINYTTEEVDNIFTQIEESITVNDSYTSKLDSMMNKALLYLTKQNPIYGSLPEDWEEI